MTDRGQIAVSEAAREIEKLMGLHPKGYDLSLDRIRRLLEALGNPERNLPLSSILPAPTARARHRLSAVRSWKRQATASMSTPLHTL